jgi:UDP-N-acetylmuramyl pentapeptide phosphotransferase/UDP-N-acetylglucosamine-1-phosphate transferase
MIIPFIIIIVMFTANSVNISDGMDGLAGGMLISSFSALTILSWINGLWFLLHSKHRSNIETLINQS